MSHLLSLYLDRIDVRAVEIALPAGVVRALYVLDGALAITKDGSTQATFGANSAVLQRSGTGIAGGSLPSRVLRWELRQRPASAEASPGAGSTLLLQSQIVLRDATDYLLRCDRVDFSPGGEALLHTHQGGGTRCLIGGSIRIDTQGSSHAYAPLQAWFEGGPDPVFAATDAQQPSAFVRVMILPLALLGGRSSIQYVRPEDRDRPKSQRYQIFIDAPIELP